MKYMIITKQHYQDLQKTILNKDAAIASLIRENKQLKKDLTDLQNFCLNFAADRKDFKSAYDIDFPNSKKGGFEGEIDTPDNLSIWEL